MTKYKIKLVYKILVSYIVVFLIILAIIYGFNYFQEKRMNNYFSERLQNSVQLLVTELSEAEYNDEDIHIIIERYIGKMPIRFKYYNTMGELVYEKKTMPPEAINQEQDIQPEWQDKRHTFVNSQLVQEQYEITFEDNDYGYIVIEYQGINNLNVEDIALLNSFSRNYRYMVIIVIVIGIITSILMTRSITKPISKISKTANEIRKGNLHARTELNTNTYELLELSNSINYLGESLEQEDMLRRQMTSDMAHEIRTPITTLRSFFEAFLDGVWEPTKDHIAKCYNEIIRMADLVERLKDIAKIEEKNLETYNERFDLSEELELIIDLFRPQFHSKGVKLASRLEKGIIVDIDKQKISQVMSNLLSNAFRYTDEKDSVQVNLFNQNDQFMIEVADTGIGIPEKDIPYIFERFYRSEKSRNRDTGGMGIGLTIVKKIIYFYKGEIEVESKINEGTIFRIILGKER